MNSIGRWPKIFSSNSTIVSKDSDDSVAATMQCIHLLLSSEEGTLFGDPEFGLRLKRYMHNQNNYILKDILVDEIYTKMITFCPQVFLERKNINITQDGPLLKALIYCKDQRNFKTNMFELVLLNTEENN